MKVSWWEMAEIAWTAGFFDSQTAAAGGLSCVQFVWCYHCNWVARLHTLYLSLIIILPSVTR